MSCFPSLSICCFSLCHLEGIKCCLYCKSLKTFNKKCFIKSKKIRRQQSLRLRSLHVTARAGTIEMTLWTDSRVRRYWHRAAQQLFNVCLTFLRSYLNSSKIQDSSVYRFQHSSHACSLHLTTTQLSVSFLARGEFRALTCSASVSARVR